MERVFRSLKSEWLPKGGYGDFSHAVRDINQWSNGYYNVYRPNMRIFMKGDHSITSIEIG